MIIDDLEFINVYGQPKSNNFSVIRGGASASVSVSTSADDSTASAFAGASASGDISSAFTGTSSALINVNVPRPNVGYIAGYSSAYGSAYAVDGYSSFASETSTSTSIV